MWLKSAKALVVASCQILSLLPWEWGPIACEQMNSSHKGLQAFCTSLYFMVYLGHSDVSSYRSQFRALVYYLFHFHGPNYKQIGTK